MPWDVSILSYRISKMYIVGQRIRALLPNSLFFASFPAFQSVPSFFLFRSSFRQSEFPFYRKAPFRKLQSAFSSWPSDVSPLPSLLRRSLAICPYIRFGWTGLSSFYQIYQWHVSYIVTFAVFCPSFSKYHRFPIIGAGRKQLWRVLITYSISQQPVWRIKPRSNRGRV